MTNGILFFSVLPPSPADSDSGVSSDLESTSEDKLRLQGTQKHLEVMFLLLAVMHISLRNTGNIYSIDIYRSHNMNAQRCLQVTWAQVSVAKSNLFRNFPVIHRLYINANTLGS